MPTLALNKKVNFDYKVLETLEAGLVLLGCEVKSIKSGHVSLKGAYFSFRTINNKPALFLIAAHVSPYKQAGPTETYNPTRERKVLLHEKQLNYLQNKRLEENLTLVPIKIYTSRSLIKIELALAQGKKKYDKREDLKNRDIDRSLRTLTKRKIR